MEKGEMSMRDSFLKDLDDISTELDFVLLYGKTLPMEQIIELKDKIEQAINDFNTKLNELGGA